MDYLTAAETAEKLSLQKSLKRTGISRHLWRSGSEEEDRVCDIIYASSGDRNPDRDVCDRMGAELSGGCIGCDPFVCICKTDEPREACKKIHTANSHSGICIPRRISAAVGILRQIWYNEQTA